MNDQQQRDEQGRFLPGHDVGRASYYRAGHPSPNPAGRPRGVNRWVRELRRRRYHQQALEQVLLDDHAPTNQREAAMRLLLERVRKDPPPATPRVTRQWAKRIATRSTVTLQWLVVDPRRPRGEWAGAYAVLYERGALDAMEDSARLRDRRRAEQFGYALEAMTGAGGAKTWTATWYRAEGGRCHAFDEFIASHRRRCLNRWLDRAIDLFQPTGNFRRRGASMTTEGPFVMNRSAQDVRSTAKARSTRRSEAGSGIRLRVLRPLRHFVVQSVFRSSCSRQE